MRLYVEDNVLGVKALIIYGEIHYFSSRSFTFSVTSCHQKRYRLVIHRRLSAAGFAHLVNGFELASHCLIESQWRDIYGHVFSHWVKNKTLYLGRYRFPTSADQMTIDVDGTESQARDSLPMSRALKRYLLAVNVDLVTLTSSAVMCPGVLGVVAALGGEAVSCLYSDSVFAGDFNGYMRVVASLPGEVHVSERANANHARGRHRDDADAVFYALGGISLYDSHRGFYHVQDDSTESTWLASLPLGLLSREYLFEFCPLLELIIYLFLFRLFLV